MLTPAIRAHQIRHPVMQGHSDSHTGTDRDSNPQTSRDAPRLRQTDQRTPQTHGNPGHITTATPDTRQEPQTPPRPDSVSPARSPRPKLIKSLIAPSPRPLGKTEWKLPRHGPPGPPARRDVPAETRVRVGPGGARAAGTVPGSQRRGTKPGRPPAAASLREGAPRARRTQPGSLGEAGARLPRPHAIATSRAGDPTRLSREGKGLTH